MSQDILLRCKARNGLLMNLPSERKVLFNALQVSGKLMHARRAKRIVKIPIKIFLPLIMQAGGIERPVNVSTFFGRRMEVVLPEAVSVQIWRYGVFEEDVAFYILLMLRSGDTFFDVGAHFGFFSMLARELVGSHGSCVSFEPMPQQRALLMKNLENYAHPGHQKIVPAALGATPGELIFKDFGLLGSAFATSKQGRDTRFKLLGEVEVDVSTLDQVVADQGITSLRLIKIDAEDAEYDVVLGGLETLRTLRPAIILEAGDFAKDDHGTRRAIDLIMKQHYLPFEFHNWALQPHEPLRSYEYQNLLLLPAELAEDIVSTGSLVCDLSR